MTLKIVSAEDIIYQGKVTAVTLPGTMGEFTVLHNHASLLATLTSGIVRYTDEAGAQFESEISGGIADVDNNTISVCVY